MPALWIRCVLSTLIALAIVAVAGCGGIKKVTVNGTVAYKGQRLSSGMLQFVGADGAYSAGKINPDGTFIVTDVVPGEVKIGIMETPGGSGSSSNAKGSTGPQAAPVALPDKYRDPEKSGLARTITSETRELHLELD